MTDTAIEWALSASELPESAAEFHARLTDLGLLPVGAGRQVLITLVETDQPAELFDFSPSERFAATQRARPSSRIRAAH